MVPKSGLMRGERLYPSSPVAAAVKVSLVEMFSSNRTVPKSQPLTKAFVTAVQERFIFFDRTSQRAAKLVPLEGRDPLSSQSLTRGIEKVPGVQRAIAQKLEKRTVQSIGARLRDHADLR